MAKQSKYEQEQEREMRALIEGILSKLPSSQRAAVRSSLAAASNDIEKLEILKGVLQRKKAQPKAVTSLEQVQADTRRHEEQIRMDRSMGLVPQGEKMVEHKGRVSVFRTRGER
jgi:hypothetical protein